MIFLQADNLKIIVPLITLGGSFVGFILARVYDRTFSERFASKGALLEKLKKRTLSNIGLDRLKADLGTAIVNLKTLLNNQKVRINNSITIISSHRFLAKGFSQDIGYSNCPEDSGELYSFFFDSETVSQQVMHDLKPITIQLEVLLNNYFAGKDTDLNLFQNQNAINPKSELFFWLHAPNYVPADVAKLNEDYNALNTVIKKWLPGAHLIMEFYVSDDLIYNRDAFANDVEKTERTLVCNKWAELVKNRNYILSEFNRGFAFGRLNYGHESLPNDVIAPRLEKLGALHTKDIVNIFGVPGSGKTFLTDAFIKSHLKGNIFIVINDPEQINAIATSITTAGKEEFFESLIGMIGSSGLPAYCTVNKETINITQFAISNILQSNSHTINIVIDDYYLYKDAIETKIKSIVSKDWRVRFLIVGRPVAEELVNSYGKKSETFECKNWNRAEALAIINHWSQKTYEEVEDTLTIDWLIKESEFSIYLLRLIERNIGNIGDNKLSDILRKEIIHSLTPVYNKLIGVHSSRKLTNAELRNALENIIYKEEDINTLKIALEQLLQTEITFEIDAFIDIIGELSWASRFEIGNPGEFGLSPELLEKQLVHLEPGLFRQIATEANIFRHNKADDVLSWRDNLIADGCLAILLSRSLHNANTPRKILEFSGRLEGLKKQYSLSILSLVLDNDSIITLTRIIGQTNYDRIDLIDELLTTQAIDKLKKDPRGERISVLNQALIDSFSLNENPKSILKLSRLIWKLCKADPRLREYFKQCMAYENFAALVAKYVFALDSKQVNEFYLLMDEYNVDWEQSTSVSILANDFVDYKVLCRRLNDAPKGVSEDTVSEIWKLYLDRHDARYAINELELMSYDIGFPENNRNSCILSLSHDFCKAKSSHKDEISLKYRIKKMVNETWQLKRLSFCAVHLKYLIYFEVHDLYHKNIEWAINLKEKYAISTTVFGPNQIVRIKALIPQTREFRLATSVQITDRQRYSAPLSTENGLELISDGMPDIDIHQKLLPVNFQLVNFNAKPLHVERATMEDLQKDAQRHFFWRPTYKFD